ncbi:MAG TPA: aminopeptidase P family protein [Terriglobia bacterium]|nr:aminopeptidase P family protein [Terriglobia bacterium]
MNTFERDKPGAKRTQTHDSAAPPNLISFMLRGWKDGAGKPPRQIKHAAYCEIRRQSLSKRFPGELLVVPAGPQKVRSNDTFYPFRPSSDFFYLTGNLEADCVLVLVPEGLGHRAALFVDRTVGKTTPAFFTDRMKGELWVGKTHGVEHSKILYGIPDVRSREELYPFLKQSRDAAPKGYRVVMDFAADVDSALTSRSSVEQTASNKELAEFLSEMRLIKDKSEVQYLRAAIQSTHRAFEDVIARLKTAKTEREIEGTFFLRARSEGNDIGYGTIAAAGAHACTLHWTRNDGQLHKGDLLLLDAGVEGHALYTADITRVLPISGKFSREQREIYTLVLEAQAAGIRAVKPGNDFLEPNRAAMQVLSEGLHRLGILKTTPEEALRDENQFYKRYSLHNVSHMLGLDVHDCAQARNETYKFGKLVPGMVLTVEPGLYFQTDDLTVPAKYRGIGVRIEDDVLVTKSGCNNLSGDIPSEAAAVEAWIRGIWK